MKVQRNSKTPQTAITAISSCRVQTPEQVQFQIRQKFQTFMNWDARSYLRQKIHSKRPKKQQQNQQGSQDVMKALLKFVTDLKKKQKFKNKREKQVQKSSSMMQNYRQRLKKQSNPLQIISFFSKHHKFAPRPYEQPLINKLIEISAQIESMQQHQHVNLQKILQEIYKLMNLIVDLNEQKLLIIVVVLAADICLNAGQLRKATYFYNQARIAAIHSAFFDIVIQALIGLAKIALENSLTHFSISLLKKALAYAWKIKDYQSEIQIYDLLGQNYCLQGKMDKANYYHQRFSRNQQQKQTSALRKIYIQIIKEDVKGKNLNLYTENIDILFLQTVKLPIYSTQILPALEIEAGQQFMNYIDGQTPRKYFSSHRFSDKKIQSAQLQLQCILMQAQFSKQMPNPDVQPNFIVKNRYGKQKRDVQFTRTLQFHEILGIKIPVEYPKFDKQYPIQKQIQILMATKADPSWYQKMKKQVKAERLQKLGSLRDPSRRSHLKVHERKRSLSSRSQKIRSSVNKAVLSWIDYTQQ